MFNFLQTIFTKITSAVASVIIAVGLVSAPVPQSEPSLQMGVMVEVKQNAQELKKIKLEAELKQAKVESAKGLAEENLQKEQEEIRLKTELAKARAETTKAKAETEKAQKEAEAAKIKIAEDDLRKQQEEQARQLEQQKIWQGLQQIKDIQQQAEIQRQKAEQDRLNLLAEQMKQKQEQELRDKQAEQTRLNQLAEEKSQLQSIISAEINKFNQQVKDIDNQLSVKKAEIDTITTEYNGKIAIEKNRLASMDIIYARIANLTDERNQKLQPYYDQYNSLVNQYNILIGAPLAISYPQPSNNIPQYLQFYPDDSGGGDLYGNGGTFHLKVEATSYGFKIY